MENKLQMVCHGSKRKFLFCVMVAQFGFPAMGLAGPVGGNIVAGQAQISQSGLNTTIDQSSNHVAIDW